MFMVRIVAALLFVGLLCLAQQPRAQLTMTGVGADFGSATASCCVLDGITTGIKAAYSTRKLLTAYAGSALRVQRASDSNQQDIGFASNVLNTSSLGTFCSGTTCTVVTWYDQSGGGFDLTVSSSSAPIIFQSGATNTINSQPAVLFIAASSDGLDNASLSANPTNTLFQNAVISANNHTGAMVAGVSSGGLEWRVDATTGDMELLSAGTAGIATSTSAVSFATGAVVESSYNSSSGAWAFWINRSTAGAGTQTQSLSASALRVGRQISPNESFDGSIGEVILYDLIGGISGGARLQIENNQKTYWGTP